MKLFSAVERALLGVAMSRPVTSLVGRRPVVIDGQTLAPDLQVLLGLQAIARRRDEQVPIEKMRAMMRSESALVGGDQPIGEVRDLLVAGHPARHYLPSRPGSTDPGPLLVFIHGGGFIEGDLDTHDAPCRMLAERSGVPVLALTYRLGPEHHFPAAHDDVDEAFRWVHDHAEELGVDPKRIAVGGDSAGGNLAASVALTAARVGLPLAWQLLIYPCTDLERDTQSLRLFKTGFYLTQEFMDRAEGSHFVRKENLSDPRASMIHAEIPSDLAPAYLVTAGFDPLRDEGEAYGRRMVEAGVEVELQRHTGLIHGFFNMVGAVGSARAAVEEMADRLRAAVG
ncbi:alpha/beta hydrolase [Nocardioides humilatus]|uniref:Alpha/beta hydrolase n=1 Tax=Nocardioides humilatus TaxID=2607660 RepID=A0A5B1LLT4_9ACTN|nr:alpha/beta hydrolase [Nocardioides humilatus]KAA1421493.1 alpha/beta hydrolase [Nocardioides humilatus]